jgi:hypothetical protein
VAWDVTTRFSPYELVYKNHALFLIELQIKTYRMVKKLEMDLSKFQKERINQLNELDEMHQEAFHHTGLIQKQKEKWHDKFINNKLFKVEDWVLLFDSRFKNFKGKFSTRWLGPYENEVVFDNGFVKVRTIDDEDIFFLVNGNILNLYKKPKSKARFVKGIMD